MSGRWKVRFHLGKGENYRHWQVTNPQGDRTFYDPEDTILRMENARLHNNCKVAEQIYNGRNKTVCAWIICDSLEVQGIMSYLFSMDKLPSPKGKKQVIYNPRQNPYWVENGKNVDSKIYSRLFTNEDGVFVEAY
tara:strand:+ start:369 stop:773 length:405 start_codon:yes stop_codon:yes gene_type:complete